MVDYAVLLMPTSDPNDLIAREAIAARLSQPPYTINQSMYEVLREYPIAISIETKSGDGALDEAKHQLYVWTSAWQYRSALLIREANGQAAAAARILVLPLLYVHGHTWRLFFAVDRGDSIASSLSLTSRCLKYATNRSLRSSSLGSCRIPGHYRLDRGASRGL